MEDYIQGIVCGYLTVQNGTCDDAKRKRMFVVLSDSRMDYYVTDPRPEFVESIAESYIFSSNTQANYYVEMNPRAPQYSFCLTTDKTTDVYIAESAPEAETWLLQMRERLEALHQIVIGPLLLRKELSTTQQFQRVWLHTKYTWRAKHVELGRSTLRFCGTQPQRRQKRAMNQFTLTAESYASDEPVEVLKSVTLTGFAVSSGALSASDLKKLQRDPKLQANATALNSTTGTNGLVYPFVVCTGPAHLHLAATSEKEREEWLLAIKLRIVALKYRHNGRTSVTTSGIRMHDFMEVQFTPGGAWKRRYVELENDMLKVKQNDRTLGSKFETRLVPSCVLTPSLLKANAFTVENLCQEIALAPGSLQDSQRWQQAIRNVANDVSLARCHKVFYDDVTTLLAHSVVYTVNVDGKNGTNAGFVVEKYKKRIFILSHTPPMGETLTIPEGSVLLGIAQVGMCHDSFETIWHKLRQKKSFDHTMKLIFRAPLTKTSLIDTKFKIKERWTLRRGVLRNGKLVLESAFPPTEPPMETDKPILEIPLRHCVAELVSSEILGVRNTLKITIDKPGLPRTVYWRVHHDGDLLVWFALLQLECAIAQDDTKHPLTLQTLKKLKQSSVGYVEDQRRQTSKCRVVTLSLQETELASKALEPKLLEMAHLEQQQLQREQQLHLVAPESPTTSSPSDNTFANAIPTSLNEEDVAQLFQHLDAIGCGKISSTAVASTIEALTRQLDPTTRTKILDPVNSALAKLVPPSRPYASITLEQTTSVLRTITDSRVVELIRKYAHHEIQCM